MKKFSLLFFALVCSVLASAQTGSAELRGFVPAGSTQYNIAQTLGQTFSSHAPAGASATLVAEGIEQGYFIEVADTLLLLSDEMGTWTPGLNDVNAISREGYDSLLHRQVYEMECPLTYDTTMAVSGHPTCNITLDGNYAATVTPNDGKVALNVSTGNPYDYPVGDTTVATWTGSVAGQTRQCNQDVIVRYFPCSTLPPVADVDGNYYNAVNVGYLCWTNKNLRTETGISNVMTYPADASTGITDMTATFGHLYTWNDAVNGTAQGICPDGWHIPTLVESQYIVNEFEALQLMSNDSQVHWLPVDGTDNYGFAFLPAGYYNPNCNCYEGLFVQGYFWTTETPGTEEAVSCMFGALCNTSVFTPGSKQMGYSVRCVLNY